MEMKTIGMIVSVGSYIAVMASQIINVDIHYQIVFATTTILLAVLSVGIEILDEIRNK